MKNNLTSVAGRDKKRGSRKIRSATICPMIPETKKWQKEQQPVLTAADVVTTFFIFFHIYFHST